MRIQETGRILKESRYTRQPSEHHENLLTRAWRMVSALPGRLTSVFHKS